MKLKDYFFSKIVFISFYIITLMIITLMLIVVGIDTKLIIFLDAFLVGIVSIYFVIDFVLTNMRLKKLKNLMTQVKDKYLIGEILPQPNSGLEREYFDIMKIVSRDAIKVAEEASREKGEYCEYVENWIHEIKTPLTACALLLDNGGDASKLKRELKRLENQTESILYYARLKNVEKDLLIIKYSVKRVIDEAVKSQMEILTAAGIAVDVKGDFEVYSDSKALGFIMKQLLVNCSKYAPKGKITISAGNNMIEVKDNGIGILAHELPRVFDRGFTGTNGRNTVGSTGMGLYIVNNMCKALNIGLEIKSEVNKFTAVYLTFANITKM